MDILTTVSSGLHLEDVALTLNRVAVGIPFMIAGFHKVWYPQRHAVFVETLEECHIPFLPYTAWFVCLTEWLGGIAVTLGLLAPLAALSLLGVALVATCTDGLKRIPPKQPQDMADWVFYFFYLPEMCWAVMLLVVILAGPGYTIV